MSKPSHCDLIQKALEAGEIITPMDALNRWGCFALSSRISELRAKGLDIPEYVEAHVGRNRKLVGIYFLKSFFDEDTAISIIEARYNISTPPRNEEGQFTREQPVNIESLQVGIQAKERGETFREAAKVAKLSLSSFHKAYTRRQQNLFKGGDNA